MACLCLPGGVQVRALLLAVQVIRRCPQGWSYDGLLGLECESAALGSSGGHGHTVRPSVVSVRNMGCDPEREREPREVSAVASGRSALRHQMWLSCSAVRRHIRLCSAMLRLDTAR